MCYPEADKPFEEFYSAMQQFESSLNDILIYDMPIKQKYIKIYDSETSSRKIYVYCQRGTELLVKVIINVSTEAEQYGKDSVRIMAEDVDIMSKIQGLDSYTIMQEQMAKIREIVHADQVAVKLQYGF